MIRVTILATIIGVAYAGVGTLQPHEELIKLRQFNELCESGRVPESGQLIDLDGTRRWVYCKREKNPHKQHFTHKARYEAPAQAPQTVFVQPSDWLLSHDILVDAILKAVGPNIYVAPPKIVNEVAVTVRPNEATPEKPRVFFLNKADSSGSSTQQNGYQSGSNQPQFGNYAQASIPQVNLSAPSPFNPSLVLNGGRIRREVGNRPNYLPKKPKRPPGFGDRIKRDVGNRLNYLPKKPKPPSGFGDRIKRDVGNRPNYFPKKPKRPSGHYW